MKSTQDYKDFLKAHATKDGDGFWTVKKPIKAFKKIRTYSGSDDPGIIFYPHRSVTDQLAKLRSRVSSHTPRAAIANLIIPVGAEIYMGPTGVSKKLRASQAIVHSIASIDDQKQVLFGWSSWDPYFIYPNGAMVGCETKVMPKPSFSTWSGTCESGIHFFLELDAALNY